MIYVGSAESEEFDQVLDTIYVGPIPEGRHMFAFQVKRHKLPLLLKHSCSLIYRLFSSSSGYTAGSNRYRFTFPG